MIYPQFVTQKTQNKCNLLPSAFGKFNLLFDLNMSFFSHEFFSTYIQNTLFQPMSWMIKSLSINYNYTVTLTSTVIRDC